VKRVGLGSVGSEFKAFQGRWPTQPLELRVLRAAVWTAAWDTAWRANLVSHQRRAGKRQRCCARIWLNRATIRQAHADGRTDQDVAHRTGVKPQEILILPVAPRSQREVRSTIGGLRTPAWLAACCSRRSMRPRKLNRSLSGGPSPSWRKWFRCALHPDDRPAFSSSGYRPQRFASRVDKVVAWAGSNWPLLTQPGSHCADVCHQELVPSQRSRQLLQQVVPVHGDVWLGGP